MSVPSLQDVENAFLPESLTTPREHWALSQPAPWLRASLQDYDRGRPTRAQIAETRAIGRDLLAAFAAVIVAHDAGQPDRLAERDSLLEPILRQNEDIGLAHRR